MNRFASILHGFAKEKTGFPKQQKTSMGTTSQTASQPARKPASTQASQQASQQASKQKRIGQGVV